MGAHEELDDLVSKGQSGVTEYELLRISALLRQLILDAQPLYAQINHEYRIAVTFRSSYPASMTEQDLPDPPFEGADTPCQSEPRCCRETNLSGGTLATLGRTPLRLRI
jgi:hypothetical protein